MKKILLVISLFSIMFLFGCSSEYMTYSTTISESSVPDIVQYVFEDFEFNNIHEDNLMYYIVDDLEGFYIMINYTKDYGYVDDLGESTNGVVDTLFEISEASNIEMNELIAYSATELNQIATAYGITLTVDDIVGFVDLERVLGNVGSYSISKIEYIEILIGRDLLPHEVNGLVDLQDAYSKLRLSGDYDLSTKSFLELKADIEGTGESYTEANFTSIETGYDILMSIIEQE